MNQEIRSQYQYALFNMAILQADFGCQEEAMAAMDEAIASARENKDLPCLNYCVSWLNHLRITHGIQNQHHGALSSLGSEMKSLEYLKTKAHESGMYSLLTSSLLNEARAILSVVGHHPWSRNPEYLGLSVFEGRLT